MQQEYFSVVHTLKLNIEVTSANDTPADFDLFESEIPEAFQLSAQTGLKEQTMFNNLRQLGDVGEQLSLYLMRQNQKIEQVLSYVLQQQDDTDLRTQSLQFGGSQISLIWGERLCSEQLLRCKIFLPEESAAIYCYLKVQSSELLATDEQSPSYRVDCAYHWLREEDLETLVRASLHIQSQQLKLRSQLRKNQNK